MITAVGGTAGPPTGHMVIAARSKSIHGPWENCPANPLVRTRSAVEKWWSRGHATLVEGPAGDWWSVYHGYENGYWTLGRQALLDPVRSEEHTSELRSLMRISYAVFCLKKKKKRETTNQRYKLYTSSLYTREML